MEIVYIIAGLILLSVLTYLFIGIYISLKVNFIRPRTWYQIYRNEWKENIPHKLINPEHKRIYLISKLGYDMSARFYPAKDKKSHKYVLMLHGYSNCSQTCGKYSLLFNAKGVNCLAPDTRRCGESKGRGITFGYYERSDAEQWIEEIYKIDPKAEIGLFGISLGAATANLVASMRSDIKYVVSYCSYSSFKEIILDKGSTIYPVMIKFLYPAIVLGGYITTGARLDMIDIVEAFKNISCPILLMHSKGDAFTPIRHAYRLHEANPKAEMKIFEKAAHARAYSTHTELYTSYLNEFLDKNA